MKTRVVISGISKDRGIPGVFECLAGMHPEFVTGNAKHVFRATLYEDDPRVQGVVEILEKYGLRVWNRDTPYPNPAQHYTIDRFREYDESDFESAELLQVHPTMWKTGGRRQDLFLEFEDVRGGDEQKLLGVGAQHIAISQSAWDRLSEWSLTGPIIRPAHLYESSDEEGDTAHRYADRDAAPRNTWWELSSDVLMPPLSPSLDIRSGRGDPVAPGYEGPWHLREDHFRQPELRYRRSDIKLMDSFDLAVTAEGRKFRKQELIASRRFWRACRELGIETGWIPVRIDEE